MCFYLTITFNYFLVYKNLLLSCFLHQNLWSWSFLLAFYKAKRETLVNLTTLKRTPETSPTAWPLQPNPATRMSSFSSIESKQPSLGTKAVIFSILDEVNPDTFPDGRVWLFDFNPYFFEHNSLGMRSTSKRVGCQSYAQMGFLVLFTGAFQVVPVVKNSPVNAGLDTWEGKIPWRRAWQPTPVFLAG